MELRDQQIQSLNLPIINQHQQTADDKLRASRERWTQESIENQASCLSKMFFVWTSQLSNLSRLNSSIQYSDLLAVSDQDKMKYTYNKFQKIISQLEQKGKKKDIVINAIWILIRSWFFWGIFYLFLGMTIKLLNPEIVQRIVECLESEENRLKDGLIYSGVLFISLFLTSILQNQGDNIFSNTISTIMMNALEGFIYQKLMRLKCSSRQHITPGQIVNLANVDVMTVYSLFQFLPSLIIFPLQIVLSLLLIILQVGPVSGLAGFITLIVGSILISYLGKMQVRSRKLKLDLSDQRGQLMTDYVKGIQTIKYLGLEGYCLQQIEDIRKREIKLASAYHIRRSQIELVSSFVPSLVVLIVLFVYIQLGNTLSLKDIVNLVLYFNYMQVPFKTIGQVFSLFGNFRISMRRINDYYGWEEKDDYVLDQEIEIGAIKVENGYFGWNSRSAAEFSRTYQQRSQSKIKVTNDKDQIKEPFIKLQQQQTDDEGFAVLKDINIEVKKGQLIGITGQTGSGKSSLLYGLINEMTLEKGKHYLNVDSKLGISSQQLWLMNSTIRDNILFGNQFYFDKYEKTLEVCQLKQELDDLKDGDSTHVKSVGQILTKGLKQRIVLARTVYNDADIYLFDDCLRNLTVEQNNSIFQKVVLDRLGDKTRIIVTEDPEQLQKCCQVVYMKNMKVHQIGKFEEIKEEFEQEFEQVVGDVKHQEQEKLNVSNLSLNASISELNRTGFECYDNISDSQHSSQSSTESNDHEVNHIIENNNHNLQRQSLFHICEIDSKEQSQSSTQLDILQRFSRLSDKNRVKANKIKESKKKSNIYSLVMQMKINKKLKSIAQKSKLKLSQRKESQFDTVDRVVLKKGEIKKDIYQFYLKQLGYFYLFLLMSALLCSQFTQQLNTLWLGYWSKDKFKKDDNFYIFVYLGIQASIAVFILIKGISLGFSSARSSRLIQNRLVRSILYNNMEWFYQNHIGRILQRTNKDQDDMDGSIINYICYFFTNLFLIIGTTVYVIIAMPPFIIVAVFVFLIYYLIINKYLKVSREIKRIEAAKRMPALSLIGETSNGQVIIRTFKKQGYFISKIEEKFDQYLLANNNISMIDRWATIQTDIVTNLLTFLAATATILSKEFVQEQYVKTVLLATALTNILKITSSFNITLKMFSQLSLSFGAVERVYDYLQLPSEENISREQPQNWPSQGTIDVQNASISQQKFYSRQLVLDHLQFRIEGSQKIGVIGKAGCGKSTLQAMLLRILQLEQDGNIKIDGVNIQQVDLYYLRSKVGVLLAEPFLFQGTVRDNLDPFKKHQDTEIQEVLQKVQLWDHLQDGINHTIQVDGSNFSLGQKQLVCIARLLLQKTKIVMIDQATSALDPKTEKMIDDLIKQEFKDSTIIFISNRISKVVSLDKVMVLDHGKIVQYDVPANLIQQQGFFREMVAKNGEQYFQKITKMIQEVQTQT